MTAEKKTKTKKTKKEKPSTKKTIEKKKTKKTAGKKKEVKKKVKTKETKKKPAFAKASVGKEAKKKEVKETIKPIRYFEAVGRRKTSVARVRLFTQGEKILIINDKPYQEYFSIPALQQIAVASLEKMKCLDHFKVSVKARGGGIHSQAEAVRHGISRALVKFNPDFRKRLRRAGYLTRDPRARERKKFGLKRARRAPQWSKR